MENAVASDANLKELLPKRGDTLCVVTNRVHPERFDLLKDPASGSGIGLLEESQRLGRVRDGNHDNNPSSRLTVL